VDACVFCTSINQAHPTTEASVYASLDSSASRSRFGLAGSTLIADLDAYQVAQDLDGGDGDAWRSGVKHDAAKVMELTPHGDAFQNGFGEIVEIETTYLFPLLKSSDLGNHRLTPRKYVLLTQRQLGDDPTEIKRHAPQTWNYLAKYAAILAQRKSSIYRNRPPFAIFGVGAYSFAPWKVGISGLYKQPRFVVVGPYAGKPVMLDDTCYFHPCASQAEAVELAAWLNAEPCQRLLRSLIFFDAKRPITKTILQCLERIL